MIVTSTTARVNTLCALSISFAPAAIEYNVPPPMPINKEMAIMTDQTGTAILTLASAPAGSYPSSPSTARMTVTSTTARVHTLCALAISYAPAAIEYNVPPPMPINKEMEIMTDQTGTAILTLASATGPMPCPTKIP